MRGGKAKTKTKKRSKASGSRSVMGRLLPPVDITNNSQLNELDKRIKMGPITLVLVYADWCGHCQRFKPMMEKLENLPGRTVQTARVKEDVFPNSSLANTKIDGYPTLMLVKNNGEVQSFKNKSGEVTNAIPDYTDMNNMSLIVKNAGKNESVNMMEMATPSAVSQTNNKNNNSANNNTVTNNNVKEMESLTPENIVTDRLSGETVKTLNNNLANSSNANIQQTTKPAVGGGQTGGSLYSQLMLAAKKVAPAAALFLASDALRKRKRRGTKKVKKSKKTRRTRRR
jgi:thiol-disulfide isomerase/thioredoxin